MLHKTSDRSILVPDSKIEKVGTVDSNLIMVIYHANASNRPNLCHMKNSNFKGPWEMWFSAFLCLQTRIADWTGSRWWAWRWKGYGRCSCLLFCVWFYPLWSLGHNYLQVLLIPLKVSIIFSLLHFFLCVLTFKICIIIVTSLPDIIAIVLH